MSGARLIGIGGHLASGKDAAADHLVERFGFTKLNMSAPLLESMILLNPIVDEAREGGPLTFAEAIDSYGYTEAKARIPEVRRLLQKFGTEVGRKVLGVDIWVDIAARRIDALRAEGKSVVITGIRFPNELTMIHDRGGDSWWIERPSQASSASHASENSVRREDFEFGLLNIGTLADLREMVDGYLEDSKEKTA